MRLLLFNLATDADDPILGFTTRWLCAIAERVESIHVITMRSGRLVLPDNVHVHSVGKEKGFSEPRRFVEFYKILSRILREDEIDVCFSHMMPLFTVLAAPVLKLAHVPIVTWYAHPSITWTLKIAHTCSDRIVSSILTSYPYKQDKLTVIGHGIDTGIFSPDAGVKEQNLPTILCVGRLSPSKDHPTLIKAVWLLRRRMAEPLQVVVIGGPGSSLDEPYVRSLREQVKTLDLDDIVHFDPPTRLSDLALRYRQCAVHVNLTSKGFVDKVALEAMACGRPSLVANEGFKETLGEFSESLTFRFGDPEDLAGKLLRVLKLSAQDREQMGRYLHRRVVERHSLKHLSFSLIEELTKARQCHNSSIFSPNR
jgi:glycosyltransferase involved in cell wall biosynthesis